MPADQWLKGAAAGAVAGLAASFAMNLLMNGVARLITGKAANDPQRNKELIAEAVSDWQERADPTGEAADSLSRMVWGRGLTPRQRHLAGPVVHYAFGTALGAGYGAAVESVPAMSAGLGVPFALGVWLAGDEIANPLLGLTAPPNRVPLASHAAQFASHIVYGMVLETVRRALRRWR